MTKIDIFSGFLGAGKTTLIKKLIKEAYVGEKLVLIENEFGEIGIDGGFLREAGIEITEMNSGCICCSLVGDFSEALKKVLAEYAPDRILIEPSGVGKLSDVIRAVRDIHAEDVVLNTFTTVVDAKKCKMYMKNFGEFFGDQITHANAVVLSHTDNMDPSKLEATLALVREHNPHATVITTPWSQLDGAQIVHAMEHTHTLSDALAELLEEHDVCPTCGHHHHDHEHHHDHGHHHEHDCDCGCHEHHHHHHADDVFTSFGKETARKYGKEELLAMVSALDDATAYGTILRAKGIVAGVDGQWLHFDYVPAEADVRLGAADVIGKICVIGADINENALKNLFKLGE